MIILFLFKKLTLYKREFNYTVLSNKFFLEINNRNKTKKLQNILFYALRLNKQKVKQFVLLMRIAIIKLQLRKVSFIACSCNFGIKKILFFLTQFFRNHNNFILVA